MTPGPDLSIITISTDEREHLERCLPSVRRALEGLRGEQFVVDNGSSDGVSEWVEREYPEVRLLRNERRLGFASNNNRALRGCAGRYVLLLNPDTELRPDTLRTMVDFLDQEPRVGAAACRLENFDGTLQLTCRRFPTLASVLLRWARGEAWWPRSGILRRYLMSDWDHETVRDVDWLLGAFLMVRREVIQQVGPLDPAYDPLYYEDIDWCWRIGSAGYRVTYVPQARAFHRYHRESARGIFNRMTYVHLRNILRFLIRRGRAGRSGCESC